MEPQIGFGVIDKQEKVLGNIDYLVRDTWSGDIMKYMIYHKPPDRDITFSPADIAEVEENRVKLNVTAEELNDRVAK